MDEMRYAHLLSSLINRAQNESGMLSRIEGFAGGSYFSGAGTSKTSAVR